MFRKDSYKNTVAKSIGLLTGLKNNINQESKMSVFSGSTSYDCRSNASISVFGTGILSPNTPLGMSSSLSSHYIRPSPGYTTDYAEHFRWPNIEGYDSDPDSDLTQLSYRSNIDDHWNSLKPLYKKISDDKELDTNISCSASLVEAFDKRLLHKDIEMAYEQVQSYLNKLEQSLGKVENIPRNGNGNTSVSLTPHSQKRHFLRYKMKKMDPERKKKLQQREQCRNFLKAVSVSNLQFIKYKLLWL